MEFPIFLLLLMNIRRCMKIVLRQIFHAFRFAKLKFSKILFFLDTIFIAFWWLLNYLFIEGLVKAEQPWVCSFGQLSSKKAFLSGFQSFFSLWPLVRLILAFITRFPTPGSFLTLYMCFVCVYERVRACVRWTKAVGERIFTCDKYCW